MAFMTNATESEESTSLIGTPPGSPDGHAKILLVDDRQDKAIGVGSYSGQSGTGFDLGPLRSRSAAVSA